MHRTHATEDGGRVLPIGATVEESAAEGEVRAVRAVGSLTVAVGSAGEDGDMVDRLCSFNEWAIEEQY